MLDEHMAKLAMEGLSLSSGEAQKVDGDVCVDWGTAWGAKMNDMALFFSAT